MQSTIVIATPAASFALMTLDEMKRALKITGTTEDPLLNDIISRASDEVATYCNRIFGKEKVVETIENIPEGSTRIYLSRWPVVPADVTSVTDNDVLIDAADYVIDKASGRLTYADRSAWTGPVIVEYSGGYELPDKAPPALKQAMALLGRETYNATQRGDASVRMISHKESRIIYFDPNAAAKGGSVSGAGTAAQRAIANILSHFTRIEV